MATKLLLTAREFAERIGVSEASVWRMTREGRLDGAAVRLPGSQRIRIRADAVERFLPGDWKSAA